MMLGDRGAPRKYTRESLGRVLCFLCLALLCVPLPPYSKRAEALLGSQLYQESFGHPCLLQSCGLPESCLSHLGDRLATARHLPWHREGLSGQGLPGADARMNRKALTVASQG